MIRLLAILLVLVFSGITYSAHNTNTTYVFECHTGETFLVQTNDSEAWVFLPNETLQLPAMKHSGVETYRNDHFELQIKAQLAQLVEAGKPGQSCINNRKAAVWEHAKLNGVDFRAVGNEPGWVLEIQQGSKIVLWADYNTVTIKQTLPKPVTDQANQTTRWDTGSLKLVVTYAKCRDSMSGDEFESVVTVYWDNRVLQGCGRALH